MTTRWRPPIVWTIVCWNICLSINLRYCYQDKYSVTRRYCAPSGAVSVVIVHNCQGYFCVTLTFMVTVPRSNNLQRHTRVDTVYVTLVFSINFIISTKSLFSFVLKSLLSSFWDLWQTIYKIYWHFLKEPKDHGPC